MNVRSSTYPRRIATGRAAHEARRGGLLYPGEQNEFGDLPEGPLASEFGVHGRFRAVRAALAQTVTIF